MIEPPFTPKEKRTMILVLIIYLAVVVAMNAAVHRQEVKNQIEYQKWRQR